MTRRDKLETAELARSLVETIADKKGADILLLDIRPITLLADYFLICTGESEPQIRAITEAVIRRVKQAGIIPLNVEGDSYSGWVLVDCGDIIVHVFAPAERSYYQLEKLWDKATVVVKMQ